MHTLKHPNIVAIYGISSKPKTMLVLDLMEYGSMEQYLLSHSE